MSSFLNLENKTFLITGVANKKSVAYFSAKVLEEKKAKERAFNDAMHKMFESRFGQ